MGYGSLERVTEMYAVMQKVKIEGTDTIVWKPVGTAIQESALPHVGEGTFAVVDFKRITKNVEKQVTKLEPCQLTVTPAQITS